MSGGGSLVYHAYSTLSYQVSQRQSILESILNHIMSLPIVCNGDFNQVLSSADKLGANETSLLGQSVSWNFDGVGLLSHGRTIAMVPDNFKSLYRCFINDARLGVCIFENAYVKTLSIPFLDHSHRILNFLSRIVATRDTLSELQSQLICTKDFDLETRQRTSFKDLLLQEEALWA